MKNTLKTLAVFLLTTICTISLIGCANTPPQDNTAENLKEMQTQIEQLQKSITDLSATINSQSEFIKDMTSSNYAYESYGYIKYIDANLSERDCYSGENFKEAQNWIKSELKKAGYNDSQIEFQNVEHTLYFDKTKNPNELYTQVDNLSVDETKTYKRKGWYSYVEDPEGTLYKGSCTTPNIIITKEGKSEKQIIIGMHYDGDGTGDNGSGIALGLATAKNFYNIKTPYTLKFVFFTAEEIGMIGSSYYANSLSQTEIDNTLYMINMDSLVCGDYCYLYGGVQDNDTKTVTKTEAYDNAMNVAKSLGLEFKSNPWTYDNLAPENYDPEYPDYASPSTGDWSDHSPLAEIGITYLYFEATNWEIPDYTGYGETYLIGMLMNTPNDYLEYIETYFPGRILSHLNKFSSLLNALLLQPSYGGNSN